MAATLEHDFAPMEAQPVLEIPSGAQWQYEPKWDGFRCLVFNENGEIDLRSKTGQPLGRYFPEVVEELRSIKANHFVLDGELVVIRDNLFSFDDLLLRIHPAQSRVRKLSAEIPATLILFDLLQSPSGKPLVKETLSARRAHLEQFVEEYISDNGNIMLSPASHERKAAVEWLTDRSLKTDGVIAKRLDLPYQSGNRKGMVKIKRLRTADCVVGGFRYGSTSSDVGSLLLGLYDDSGQLHHVGFTSSLSADEKHRLTAVFEELLAPSSFDVNIPGGPSRWSNERSTEWMPLKPKLVVEVQYDHFTGGRFRHGTKFLRWRPDKKPRKCTLDQIV